MQNLNSLLGQQKYIHAHRRRKRGGRWGACPTTLILGGALPHHFFPLFKWTNQSEVETCRVTVRCRSAYHMQAVNESRNFDLYSKEPTMTADQPLMGEGTSSAKSTSVCIPVKVQQLYGKDLNLQKLSRQLNMLPDLVKAAKETPKLKALKKVTSVRTVAEMMTSVPMSSRLFSERHKLRIYLTLPVTTATAGRKILFYSTSSEDLSQINHESR